MARLNKELVCATINWAFAILMGKLVLFNFVKNSSGRYKFVVADKI